jgi:RNA polymerase sigma factor (sigma-70 family)
MGGDEMVQEAGVESLADDLSGPSRQALLRFFLRRVRNRSEAEDLTQEMILRLLRRPTDIPIRSLGGFIRTAANNLLRDRARAAAHRGHELEIDANAPAHGALVEDFTPERVLVGRERLSEVLTCLDELPLKTRDAFLLFRLEHMKQGEIARALGVSVSSVEKHVARAAAHLVQRFGPTGAGRADDGF